MPGSYRPCESVNRIMTSGTYNSRLCPLIDKLRNGFTLVEYHVRQRIFILASVYTPALRLLLSNGYPTSFPGGKARLGRDADRSPPSGNQVKNE
jgi:hypothetical protein